MQSTISISIGRNIPGDGPMFPETWQAFKGDVQTVLTRYEDVTPLAITEGTGSYEGESEETFIVLALFPTAELAALKSDLIDLAIWYGQEAIGLIAQDSNETLIYNPAVQNV